MSKTILSADPARKVGRKDVRDADPWRQALDRASDAVFWIDCDGGHHYVNHAAATLLGYSVEALMDLSVFDYDDTRSADDWADIFLRVSGGEIRQLDTTWRHRHGSDVPVTLALSILEQTPDRLLCVFARERLVQTSVDHRNELLMFTVNNATDAVYIYGENRDIIYANATAAEQTGYTPAELSRMNVRELDPAYPPRQRDYYWELSKIGKRVVLETRHRRKDGSYFPVEISHGVAVFDGRPYCGAFVRDITARKQTEQQNEEFRYIIDHAVDAIYVYDAQANIRYANETAARQSGYAREELKQMNLLALDAEFSVAELQSTWAEAARGKTLTFETRHSRKDGSVFPVEVSYGVTDLGSGSYGCAFVRDITERKEAQRAVEQLSFAIDSATDAIYRYDSGGRIVYASQGAARATGYSVDELIGMSLGDLDDRFDPALNQRLFASDAPLGTLPPLERLYRRKDGSFCPVEINVSMTEFEGARYAAAMVRDISERKAIERRMRLTQFAIDHAGDAVFFSDREGQILYANETACRERQYQRARLLTMNVRDIDSVVKARNMDRTQIWNELSSKGPQTIESAHRRQDGTTFPVEIKMSIMDFEGDQISCTVVRDITERIQAQHALTDSEERFRIIADTSPIALLISRLADGKVLYANSQAELLFGEVLQGGGPVSLVDLWQGIESAEDVIGPLMRGDHVDGSEIMLQRHNQPPMWLSLNTRSIELQGERVVCCVMLDITRAYELSRQLSYHATYDALTGLVNRREFEERLQKVIKDARPNAENALCYLDLDQFKVINDSCGHFAGDELLRQISQAFTSKIRKHDTLARLGGDEFAILLQECGLAQAERVASMVRQTVQDFRFAWGNRNFSVGVSIGVVPIGGAGESMTKVLQRADSACYAAKDRGRNRIHVYSPNDEELAQRRGEMQWVGRINTALEQNRLQLWSQKIMAVSDGGEGEHFEVLIRMLDEQGAIIAPGAFLPAAERYNLASRIDRWVTQSVFEWLTRHPQRLEGLALCAINLSGQSLSDEEFMTELLGRFDQYPVPPGKICFEVTETAAVANLSHATQFLTALKKRGCSIALDDFGSGLSSFAYLKTLPVDYLKIDGQFVRDIDVNLIDRTMVQSINQVGHVMGKKTIAEFVENDAILAILRRLGVDYAQGYGIAPPRPLGE